jgi:hypothetical protein
LSESGARSPGGAKRTATFVTLAGLAASALALALAPQLMPSDYSWVEHTTSESGAQGIAGAWLARAGLLLFGLSVLLACTVKATDWGRIATAMHVLFGTLLTASAAFSTRSWRTGSTFDAVEDALHSVAATGMGFAFALGILAVLVVGADPGIGRRGFGVVAIVAAAALPMGMALWGDSRGALQRLMFAIGYLWYGSELIQHLRTRSRCAEARPVDDGQGIRGPDAGSPRPAGST